MHSPVPTQVPTSPTAEQGVRRVAEPGMAQVAEADGTTARR